MGDQTRIISGWLWNQGCLNQVSTIPTQPSVEGLLTSAGKHPRIFTDCLRGVGMQRYMQFTTASEIVQVSLISGNPQTHQRCKLWGWAYAGMASVYVHSSSPFCCMAPPNKGSQQNEKVAPGSNTSYTCGLSSFLRELCFGRVCNKLTRTHC